MLDNYGAPRTGIILLSDNQWSVYRPHNCASGMEPAASLRTGQSLHKRLQASVLACFACHKVSIFCRQIGEYEFGADRSGWSAAIGQLTSEWTSAKGKVGDSH